MPTRPRRITQTLQLPLPLVLLHLVKLQAVELLHSEIHRALLAENLHLNDARFDRLAQVADTLQQRIGLADLVRSLLKTALRCVDSAIAVRHVLADVALVVEVEAPFSFLRIGGALIFFAEVREMLFRAGSEVLLGVCEEVVWTAAAEVGAADFGVGDGKCGLFLCAGPSHELVAHQLLEQLALFGRHVEGVCWSVSVLSQLPGAKKSRSKRS